MDEYIKREDALDAVLFALVGTGYQSKAIYAIRDVPTAYVAPRADVAREIFEEIEAATDYFKELKGIPAMAVSFREYFSKRKEKYTGEQT